MAGNGGGGGHGGGHKMRAALKALAAFEIAVAGRSAALAGGHIDAHVAVPVSYKALAEAKKVRIIGVGAEKRTAPYEEIPTFRENGVDLVIGSFHIVFAPRGTPGSVQAKLAGALGRTMKEPELRKRMTAANLGIAYMDQKQTAQFLAEQDRLYRGLIEELGMRVKK